MTANEKALEIIKNSDNRKEAFENITKEFGADQLLSIDVWLAYHSLSE